MSYDNWLEAPYQDSCAGEDVIQERIYELLKDKYNVANFDNFYEAVTDIDTVQYNKLKESLSDALATQNFEHIGRTLWSFAIDKMERYAENEAMEDYENGYLRD